MAIDPTTLVIPAELKPADGRFGAGPSKVRAEQLKALVSIQGVMGTSPARSRSRRRLLAYALG